MVVISHWLLPKFLNDTVLFGLGTFCETLAELKAAFEPMPGLFDPQRSPIDCSVIEASIRKISRGIGDGFRSKISFILSPLFLSCLRIGGSDLGNLG